MKLKCNVHVDCGIIDTLQFNADDHDYILCPSCDKKMAYSGQRFGSRKYEWFPLDSVAAYTKDGRPPVEVIED